MKRLSLAGLLAMGLSACADADGPRLLTQADMGSATVSLAEQAGQCVLSQGDQQLPLNLQWPCTLSPDRAGNARVERFNGVPIVLVTHVQPHPTLKGECLKTSRAVRLTEAGLEASVAARSASCDSGVEDQKIFVGLFQW